MSLCLELVSSQPTHIRRVLGTNGGAGEPCLRPAAPTFFTLGKVARAVRYVKENGLAGFKYPSLAALNGKLHVWMREVADRRALNHNPQDTPQRIDRRVPVHELAETQEI